MTYIKIEDVLYPASVSGKLEDRVWDNRESKSITLEMDYVTAAGLFVNDLAWGIIYEEPQEDGSVVTEEYDNSEFCVAGSITDNRDGTVTVKMGKHTEVESLQKQIENSVTEAELESAYVEGVNSL